MSHHLGVLILALLAVSGCGPRGTLEVEVVEGATARPMRGAIVQMRPVAFMDFCAPGMARIATDEHGLAIFRPRPFWRYDVSAEFEGYIDADSHEVVVNEKGETYIHEGRYALRYDAPGETRRLRIEMKRDEAPKPVRSSEGWGGHN